MLTYIPTSARSILDVGCSSGEFGSTLRAERTLDRLVGVEMDPARAEVAANRATYTDVINDSFASARIEGSYDVVVFNDVLEHMVSPGDALSAAKELLNPKGVVVASIPNVRHLSVTGPLLVQGEWRYRDAGILDRTHLRFFTRRSIIGLFGDAGLRILSEEGIGAGLRAGESPGRIISGLVRALIRCGFGEFFFVQYAIVATAD